MGGCKQKEHDSWCIAKETWSCVPQYGVQQSNFQLSQLAKRCNLWASTSSQPLLTVNRGRNAKALRGIPQIGLENESIHVKWKSRMLERFENRHVRWLESQSLLDWRASKQIITKRLRKEKGVTVPYRLALAIRGPPYISLTYWKTSSPWYPFRPWQELQEGETKIPTKFAAKWFRKLPPRKKRETKNGQIQ